MRNLPDLSGVVVEAGDPVVPERLNLPSGYADVFRDHFGVEHRVEDFEHASPLAPVAFGYFRWDGSKYAEVGPNHNIKSVNPMGPGDVEVVLDPASRTVDDWFPVVSPRSADGGGVVMWWEYDDGGRTATRCRLRFVRPEFQSSDQPEDWTSKDTDTDFLFAAYMYRRATGAAGLGSGTPAMGVGVKHRICVDGVESAQHRQALLDYCAGHRVRWSREHGPHGEHAQPRYPLAAWQIRRPLPGEGVGRIQWQAGPLDELAWEEGTSGLNIGWRTSPGKQWRGLMYSLRYAGYDPPLRLLDALALRATGETAGISGPYREVGGLRLMSIKPYSVRPDSDVWGKIVSVGGVLTGM